MKNNIELHSGIMFEKYGVIMMKYDWKKNYNRIIKFKNLYDYKKDTIFF